MIRLELVFEKGKDGIIHIDPKIFQEFGKEIDKSEELAVTEVLYGLQETFRFKRLIRQPGYLGLKEVNDKIEILNGETIDAINGSESSVDAARSRFDEFYKETLDAMRKAAGLEGGLNGPIDD